MKNSSISEDDKKAELDCFIDNIRWRYGLFELKDFVEVGLCGTAAVISPIGQITDHEEVINVPSGMQEIGPVLGKLRETLTGIQMGEIDAPSGWVCEIA